jgi:hypothetical protein
LGGFTLGVDEQTYYKINPPETNVSTCKVSSIYDKSKLQIVHNGKLYRRDKNPYEQAVNVNTFTDTGIAFSFKAKSFYDKALELSSKSAGMENIFNHIYNPNEYRYYKVNYLYLLLWKALRERKMMI